MNKEKIFRIVGGIIATIVLFFTGRQMYKSNKDLERICNENAAMTKETAENIIKNNKVLKEADECINKVKEQQADIEKLLTILDKK